MRFSPDLRKVMPMEKYIIMKNIKLLFQTKCDKYLERAKKLKSHLEKKLTKIHKNLVSLLNNNHDRKNWIVASN